MSQATGGVGFLQAPGSPGTMEESDEDNQDNYMQEDLPSQGPEPDTPMTEQTPLQPLIQPPSDLLNPELNTYAQVKLWHEQECFKILQPFTYVVLIKGCAEISQFSPVELKHFYSNRFFYEKDKHDKWEKKQFVPRWQADEQIKYFNCLVVDPENNSPLAYNLWKGYIAASLPPVDPSLVDNLIKPIVDHISNVITNGKEADTNWFMDYMANIVQQPKKRTQVGIQLYGTEGSGKGMIFDFYRKCVLGDHCTKQSSNVEHELFSRFSNLSIGCVFAQLDEIPNLHSYWDRLKDLITNRTINYEKKNKDPIVLDNLVNLIFTTNNENALKVSPNDRRFAFFRCSNIYLTDQAYKVSFGSYLERKDVARAFYQHLMSRDLSAYPYDFQHSRPITEYYQEAQLAAINPFSRFLSALVNDNSCEDIKAKDLYERYKRYITDGGYKCLKTISSFGTDMKRVNGVCCKRMNYGMVYKFNKDLVQKTLVESKQYDPEATWL